MTLFRSAMGNKPDVLYLSPWLMVGLAVILGMVVAVFAVRNTQREKSHMTQNIMDRAEAFIWALEAGARTWEESNEGSQHLQELLSETAKQPGIAYIAVTNDQGQVLAHSDKLIVGQELHDPNSINIPSSTDSQQWRLLKTPGGDIFEVYKIFRPNNGLHGLPLKQDEALCIDCRQDFSTHDSSKLNSPTNKDLVIFLGFKAKPFEEALAEDFRNTVLVAILVGLLGFGGFVSLFWAQNYRLSKRMLQDTRAFADVIVTNLPVGLLVIDPVGTITMVNDTISAMFGTTREKLEQSMLHTKGSLNWETIIHDLSENKTILEKEAELLSEDGMMTPVSISASRIINEEGLFLGYLFIVRDLKEMKHLQEQVRRNERLTALGNLAAGVAHEIRNPLSSIKGFATYLYVKVSNKGQGKEAVSMIIQEVERLNRVVSELLEFARPGSMRLKFDNLNQVVERALRLASSDASAKDIKVTFFHNEALPLVPVDAEKLTQALLNLFLNSIQATTVGGSLTVSTSLTNAQQKVVIRISDTGKGIHPEVLPGIFNPYFTTKPSGTGLGLAIVHRIVERHKGDIDVESVVGKGTVFLISIPVN